MSCFSSLEFLLLSVRGIKTPSTLIRILSYFPCAINLKVLFIAIRECNIYAYNKWESILSRETFSLAKFIYSMGKSVKKGNVFATFKRTSSLLFVNINKKRGLKC